MTKLPPNAKGAATSKEDAPREKVGPDTRCPEKICTSEDYGVGGAYRKLGQPLTEDVCGERFDDYLAKTYPFLSRTGWQKRLRSGRLRVNGRCIKPAHRVRLGDQVTLFYPREVEPEVDRGIEVLYQEAGIAAVYKPSDLPMHENGPYRFNTFAELIKDHLAEGWSAVHRLDRETSGLVLCAETAKLRAALSISLARKTTHKTYLAVVKGVPTAKTWQVDQPIGDLKTSQIRIKKWVVPGGLPSMTEFEVLSTDGTYSLLKAYPKTGRTNQIRIHSAWSGYTLVGDKLFHSDENLFIDCFEKRADRTAVINATGHHRLCLHAAGLEFYHPALKRTILVQSPLPEDMGSLTTNMVPWSIDYR